MRAAVEITEGRKQYAVQLLGRCVRRVQVTQIAIALHAMDNAAMLISELAALAAFKLHDSVDILRVSAVQTQLRNGISEIIACTQSLAALREQLMGVNAKAELAA